MEVENKPNQTDPSQEPAETEESISLDDLIKERVAEAIAKQQPPKEEPSKEDSEQGGKDSDVSTQKDSSSVTDPNVEVLKFVEGFSGRKFESLEEATKYARNLNSMVGDQTVAEARKTAQLYNKFVEKWAGSEGKTVDEAKKFWADTLTAEKAELPLQKKEEPKSEPPKQEDKTSKEVVELKQRLDRADLLKKYPFAELVQEEVALIAKQKGVSQIEAFESSPLKELAETKAKEESKKSPVVTSSNRVGFDKKKVQDAATKAVKTGSLEDKIELVKALGLNK